ncbi:MAG TPA: hypothetical protein VGN37_17645 [Actinocatenispora sp.]
MPRRVRRGRATVGLGARDPLKQPTFAALPVAKARQIHHWNFQNQDYVAQARTMTDLAGWLDRSRTLT